MKVSFKKRTKLEKLKDRYRELMNRSFKKALTDKEQSDKIKEEAAEIFEEIKMLQKSA